MVGIGVATRKTFSHWTTWLVNIEWFASWCPKYTSAEPCLSSISGMCLPRPGTPYEDGFSWILWLDCPPLSI
ncbi:hypothetical protein Pan54_15340 [Rubinisphaera italica]|uniref:Uncharacterized protein n=1 Tax=Rubinisphaera italica TaxID=2527969 RepID=A0A5C5XCD7_9PLAN|nr:hypothetical protein Pan54_15340 [Rubinisphaera italica]